MGTDDAGRGERGSGEGRGGFLAGENVWILVPLAALSIPIVAVSRDSPLVWAIGAVLVVAALTASARYLLGFRHDLRLREIAAQERLAAAERDRLVAVDRMLEREGVPLGRLDDRPPPRPARPTEVPAERVDEADPPR